MLWMDASSSLSTLTSKFKLDPFYSAGASFVAHLSVCILLTVNYAP